MALSLTAVFVELSVAACRRTTHAQHAPWPITVLQEAIFAAFAKRGASENNGLTQGGTGATMLTLTLHIP